MKNINRSILTGFILLILSLQINAQDVRLIKTKVADILMQMPAKSADQTNALTKQLLSLGNEGIVEVLGMLKAPGEGDDVSARFAITSLARITSQKGQEKDWELVQINVLKAIQSNTNKDVQAYLIHQLNYGANDNSVDLLKNYLTDEKLCGPVAQVFLSLRSEKAINALVAALPTSTGANQVTIVKALGDLQSKAALSNIIKLEGGSDKTLQRTVLSAIANIGEATSYTAMWNAAKKVNFGYEPTEATAAFLKYADKLGANKELKLCKQACQDIIKANNQNNLLHNQSAALAIYSKYFKAETMPILLKLVDNPDSSFRMSVLNIAKMLDDPANTGKWIDKAKKAPADVKADIIYMLGNRNDKTAVPFIRENLKDKSEKVRIEAIWALVKLDEQIAKTDLLDHLAKGNDVVETEKALSTLLDEKQLDKVANALSQATDAGKQGLLNLLAAKSGKRYFKDVYSYALSNNPIIKSSAIAALTRASGFNDVTYLFQLLPDAKEKQDIENLQKAIVHAIKDAEDQETIEKVVLPIFESSTQKELILPVLPFVGGGKALEMVVKSFNESQGSIKNASLLALVNWKDTKASAHLLNICKGSSEFHSKAFKGYVNQIINSNLPDDQKLLKLQMIMPLAQNAEEKNLVLESLSDVKTFLSLVYVSNYLDDTELQQVAAYSAIRIAAPDGEGKNGLTGNITKAIALKCSQIIKGNESDYIKASIKKYIDEMSSDPGFVPMFNGKDLSGWKPYVADPIALATLNKKDFDKKLIKATEKMHQNWSVKDGMIAFSGEGDNLLSEKEYGDFEMIVNWRITKKGDSGIYLRGSPQVQIWDTTRVDVGAQVGSGGLYNNQKNESKPLKVADNPIDEWNTFRITMIGERVTVYLNGELVVNNVILENYWNRNIPIFPKGTIELQAHGTDLVFKDIYIHEIPSVETGITPQEKSEGFIPLFNGINLDGWVGNKTEYQAIDGKIVIQPSEGEGKGNLYTEKEYSDFNYRFEFQLTPGANNGLGIRAPLEGDAAYVGMELQILDNEAPVYADLKPYQYHGSVYGVIPAKRGFLKPTGEWNSEEVIVSGKNVKVILNGTVILDGNIEEASKNGTMDHNQHPGLLRDKGHIGFLGHGSVVSFKNIRIKELK